MKIDNLKRKFTKMNIEFTEDNSSVYFSVNEKQYEASVTISGNISGYCTANYSKFDGRTFENLNQVIKHSLC
jgi:hypothetical protein